MIKFILALCFFLPHTRQLMAQVIDRDSTHEERFVAHVLNDYAKGGVRVFVRIDSIYLLPNNFELVEPEIIFKNFYAGINPIYPYIPSEYILNAFMSLTNPNIKQFERYPQKFPLLQGIKVNMKIFKKIAKLETEKIIEKYFNDDKTYKKKFCRELYEVVAVCYTRQVQVITPKNSCAYFLTFE